MFKKVKLLNLDSIQFICNIVDADLRRPTRRNHALSVETQVLASMRFLASGWFYHVDADVLGIDKSSICWVLKGFCEALVSKSDRFLSFHLRTPRKTKTNWNFIKWGWGGGFPSCILLWMAFTSGYVPRIQMKMHLSTERDTILSMYRRWRILITSLQTQLLVDGLVQRTTLLYFECRK